MNKRSLHFSSYRSNSSSDISHLSTNYFNFSAYFFFICSVLAGFSVFKNKEKSLSIVSLIESVGYFSLFSLTSLKALVTIQPNDYSINDIESSIFYKLCRDTQSTVGGILTGRLVLEYLKGFAKNLCNLYSESNKYFPSLKKTSNSGSP